MKLSLKLRLHIVGLKPCGLCGGFPEQWMYFVSTVYLIMEGCDCASELVPDMMSCDYIVISAKLNNSKSAL